MVRAQLVVKGTSQNYLGILLKCRFWFSRSGGGIEILHFSNSLAMMQVLVHWPCLQVVSKRVRLCSYEMQSNTKPLWVWFGFICLKFCGSFKTQLCHPLPPRSCAFWIPGLTSGTFSLLLPFIKGFFVCSTPAQWLLECLIFISPSPSFSLVIQL